MKITHLTTLKHKLQWLVLLAALLGVSQGVWGDEYPTKTPVYVRALTSKSYTTVALYVWGGTASISWPGQTMTYMGSEDSYDYWTCTFEGTFTKMIVTNGDNTKYSGGDGDVTSGYNCIEVTGTSYSWTTYTPCSTVGGTANVNGSTTTNISRGASVTLSLTGETPGSTVVWQKSTDGGSSWSNVGSTTDTPTQNTQYRAEVTNGCVAYSSVATVKMPTNIYVDVSASELNWSGPIKIHYWNGGTDWPGYEMTAVPGNDGWYTYEIAYDKDLYGYIINNNGGNTNNQTVDVTPIVGAKNCIRVNTATSDNKRTVSNTTCPTICTPPTKSQYTMASGQSVTYDGSAHAPSITVNNSAGSVAKIYGSTDNGTNWTYYAAGPINAGTYNIKVDVNAGGDYCAANGIVLDNTYAITQKTPTASDFNFSNLAQTLPTTIVAVGVTPKSGISGMGSVSQIYYDGSTKLPTTAGTYAVTFDVAAGTNYSAATGLSAGNLVISKSNQTTPTVNNLASHCGTGDYTLGASNGESNGYYSYAIVSGGTGTATIEDNETETVTLSVTAVGTIIVKAKKLGDANYNASSYSANKTFTIKANSTASEYTIEDDYNEDYTGSAQTPDITIADGAGDISNYYYSSDNGSTWTAGKPTNAGVYKIKVDVAEGTSYCAANGIVITNTFTINKINPTALTIDNTIVDFVYCSGANTTLVSSGGEYNTSDVVYEVVSGSGTIEGDVLTATSSGSVTVRAKKATDTNYNAVTSANKTFNFNIDAPEVYELSNVGGATTICGDPSSGAGSGTLRLANSQTGYKYQLYSNGAPIEGYAAKAGTTDSSIDFPVTSSGTYTVYAYYGDNSTNCPTRMDGEITLTISTQPRLVRSAASVTQYMPVTITSVSTDIAEWKIVDGSGNDVSSSTAYLFDQTYDAISFKGASTNGSTAKTYTIQATTAGGCSEKTTITVNPDTEACN